jgi:virginiamycin B lyase
MCGTAAHPRRGSPLSIARLLLALAATILVGCSSQSTPPAHPFAGTVHLVSIPAPYQIPVSLVLGKDGNLWFPAVADSNFGTNNPSGAIGRLTPDGKISLFPFPTNAYPSYITLGPDGNCWFVAMQGEGQVGHGVDTGPGFAGGYFELGSITSAGELHLIPLPAAPQHDPISLVTGPDGNFWFTEYVSPNIWDSTTPHIHAIARMTPAGVITDFPMPTPTDIANFITKGPDGNLWFTIDSNIGQNAHGKIGRITPQGKITVLDTPSNIFGLSALTNGADGNLWVSGGRYILRVTPAGQVKEFPMPTVAGKDQYDQPFAANIIAGPDGALWFLSSQHWIGRMTTDGKIQQYPYSSKPDFPESWRVYTTPAFAADGTLWITNGTLLAHFT